MSDNDHDDDAGHGPRSRKEYSSVEFTFVRPSMLLDGMSYEVTAFLLVPVELMPELQRWHADEIAKVKENHVTGPAMYKALLAKGAFLHREEGPAYTETERKIFDNEYARIVKDEFWKMGVKIERNLPAINPAGPMPI